MIVDFNGEKTGKLQDVYVDVETDEPQFGTIKQGFVDRHLTFVPLRGIQVGPNELQVLAPRNWSGPHPSSGWLAKNSRRKTSRPCTTTLSRTTRRRKAKVDAASRDAEQGSAVKRRTGRLRVGITM